MREVGQSAAGWRTRVSVFISVSCLAQTAFWACGATDDGSTRTMHQTAGGTAGAQGAAAGTAGKQGSSGGAAGRQESIGGAAGREESIGGAAGDDVFAAGGASGRMHPDQGGAGAESASGGNAAASGSSGAGEGGDGGDESQVPAIVVTTEPTLRAQRGSSSGLRVDIERKGGFSGVIELSVEGLPAGVGADPVILPAVEDGGVLIVVALNTAAPGGPNPITIRAGAIENANIFGQVSVDFYVADQPGDADRSFGREGNGTVTERITDRELDVVTDMAIDSHGRVVVAGVGQQTSGWLGWVLRLTSDGEFDTTFAGDGIFDEFGGVESSAERLVLEGDATFVAAETNDGMTFTSYLRKFTATGDVDTSYGTGGDVDLGGAAVSGLMNWGPGLMLFASSFLFEALDAQGDLDTSFDLTGSPNVASAAVDSQKRLLYGGYAVSGPFSAGRFTASGDPDTSFGTTGEVTFPIAGAYVDYVAEAIRAYPDDGAVMLAQARASGRNIYHNRVVLIRVDANGDPDTNFGTNGLTGVSEDGIALDVVAQSDGKVVVLYAKPIGEDVGLGVNFVLARFEPDGSLDRSFAASGVLDLDRVYAGDPDGLAYDAAAGRLIVSGFLSGSGISLFRLWL